MHVPRVSKCEKRAVALAHSQCSDLEIAATLADEGLEGLPEELACELDNALRAVRGKGRLEIARLAGVGRLRRKLWDKADENPHVAAFLAQNHGGYHRHGLDREIASYIKKLRENPKAVRAAIVRLAESHGVRPLIPGREVFPAKVQRGPKPKATMDRAPEVPKVAAGDD